MAQPPVPPVPPTPTDLFSQLALDVFVPVWQIVDDLGLRTYRVWLYTRIYNAPGKQGGISREILTEILPSPKLRFVNANQIARAQGLLQEGDVAMTKIRRDFTEEQLRGKTISGDDLPPEWDFKVAIMAKGQRLADLYAVMSEPYLGPVDWSMLLRPSNESTTTLPAPVDPQSTP